MVNNKSKKSSQKLRKLRKSKVKTYRKRFSGGYGPTNFSELSTKTYYATNNYNDDPNNPTIMQTERLSNPVLRGGKKRVNKSRKMNK